LQTFTLSSLNVTNISLHSCVTHPKLISFCDSKYQSLNEIYSWLRTCSFSQAWLLLKASFFIVWLTFEVISTQKTRKHIQYSQRHSVINHCDRRINHLGDFDISFVLLNILSNFLLHLECYLLSPKRHIKINK
jgi:hypothetical protein